MKIRVCLFDDSKKVRDALKTIFISNCDIEWCGGFPDCSNLINDFQKANPDVVMMDIQIPGMSGIEAVKELKKEFPEVRILMLTNFEDDDKVFSSLCFGASGYLLKRTPPEKIIEAIKEVFEGGAPMSPIIARKVIHMFRDKHVLNAIKENNYNLTLREKEVLECLIKGHSLKIIADELFISYETVRTHIKHIYEKLHVVSMTEAVVKALNERIISG